MPSAPGTRVGPYELTSAVGAGGMGEVWRARDSQRHRDVAIKPLPPSVAGDSQYMARLHREAQLLAAFNHGQFHHLAASPDEKWLAVEIGTSSGSTELGNIDLARPDTIRPFPTARSTKRWPQLSPDSKWLAYASDESGTMEIYVQSLNGGGRWQVSRKGGFQARWRGGGKELIYYERAGRYMSVSVQERNGAPEFGIPVLLFQFGPEVPEGTARYFSIAWDAQRLLVSTPVAGEARRELEFLIDWMPQVRGR